MRRRYGREGREAPELPPPLSPRERPPPTLTGALGAETDGVELPVEMPRPLDELKPESADDAVRIARPSISRRTGTRSCPAITLPGIEPPPPPDPQYPSYGL